jgi:hypothetical protein
LWIPKKGEEAEKTEGTQESTSSPEAPAGSKFAGSPVPMDSLQEQPAKKQKTEPSEDSFLELPKPKEGIDSHPVSLMLPDKPRISLDDLAAFTLSTTTIWALVLKSIEGGAAGDLLKRASVRMDEVTRLKPSFEFKKEEDDHAISVKEIAAVFNQFTGKELQDQETLFKDNQVDEANIIARFDESISRMYVLEIPKNLSLSWVLRNIAEASKLVTIFDTPVAVDAVPCVECVEDRRCSKENTLCNSETPGTSLRRPR